MIVYAVNIHTGGGKVLLDALLLDQPFGPVSVAYVDQRYIIPNKLPANIRVVQIKPTPFWRIFAEIKMYCDPQYRFEKEVLFFGNLPPLFRFITSKNKDKMFILYLQNAFLVKNVQLPNNSKKQDIKLFLERIWLYSFISSLNKIWVQTEWMKKLLKNTTSTHEIEVKPFLPHFTAPPSELSSEERPYQFVYVGSTSKHKRLDIFLNALSALDKFLQAEKRTLKVCIILEAKASLEAIKHMLTKLKNINVNLISNASREQIFEYYSNSRFFIATSLVESFYLPLYEAHHFGCKIVVPKGAGYAENLEWKIYQYEANSLDLKNYLKNDQV